MYDFRQGEDQIEFDANGFRSFSELVFADVIVEGIASTEITSENPDITDSVTLVGYDNAGNGLGEEDFTFPTQPLMSESASLAQADLPSIYVGETVNISGLDALSGTSTMQSSSSSDNQLSIQDVLADAGGENINVEEILNSYAGENSAAENATIDASSSDTGDQTVAAYNDSGSGVENYVSMADIMNAVDDGGTSGVYSDIGV